MSENLSRNTYIVYCLFCFVTKFIQQFHHALFYISLNQNQSVLHTSAGAAFLFEKFSELLAIFFLSNKSINHSHRFSSTMLLFNSNSQLLLMFRKCFR